MVHTPPPECWTSSRPKTGRNNQQNTSRGDREPGKAPPKPKDVGRRTTSTRLFAIDEGTQHSIGGPESQLQLKFEDAVT